MYPHQAALRALVTGLREAGAQQRLSGGWRGQARAGGLLLLEAADYARGDQTPSKWLLPT
jgi:hypothetical protein